MAKTFKYRVCQTQAARVTFVNGRCQGLQVTEEADAAGAATLLFLKKEINE